MCAANKCSLEVSYVHLGEVHALLAIWLTDLPKEMLQIFDEVLYLEVIVLFPHYAQVITMRYSPFNVVRISNMTLTYLWIIRGIYSNIYAFDVRPIFNQTNAISILLCAHLKNSSS